MELDRKKIIIILSAVLVVIWALFLWWLFRQQSKNNSDLIDVPVIKIDAQAAKQLEILPPAKTAVPVESSGDTVLGLKQLAFSFAERFGSYSNQNNFKWLNDLKPLATNRMQQTLDEIMAKGLPEMNGYDGYTTTALSGDFSKYDKTAAEITIKTQRAHSLADKAPDVFYQDIFLKLKKEGNNWKVDEATWQ